MNSSMTTRNTGYSESLNDMEIIRHLQRLPIEIQAYELASLISSLH